MSGRCWGLRPHIIHSHEPHGPFQRTPVEVLRAVVQMCDRMPESFNERYSIAELVRLWQVAQLCEWDYDPHQWSEDQIADALGDGIIPTFDEE